MIHVELGLSTDEEGCHLDHRVSDDEWNEMIGDTGGFHFLDSSISQIVSKMLRHGTCYRRFGTDALGYSSLAEVTGLCATLAPTSTAYVASATRAGCPQESYQFLSHG